MVVDSILPHAESGPNDHRKEATPFTSSKTCFREYSDDGSFSLIVPNSLDNDFWKDTSRLVLIVHGMNGNSKGGIRGIEYDFPGTKTIYLEYEKVCYKKSLP